GGINYDGDNPCPGQIGAGTGGIDRLTVTASPATPAIGRETYLVGATADPGPGILDPDASPGPGAAGTLGIDAEVIHFTGLNPVDTDVPAAAFDVIMNSLNNDASIVNGGLLNGVNSLQVTDNDATFETFRFANKVHVRIMGQS